MMRFKLIGSFYNFLTIDFVVESFNFLPCGSRGENVINCIATHSAGYWVNVASTYYHLRVRQLTKETMMNVAVRISLTARVTIIPYFIHSSGTQLFHIFTLKWGKVERWKGGCEQKGGMKWTSWILVWQLKVFRDIGEANRVNNYWKWYEKFSSSLRDWSQTGSIIGARQSNSPDRPIYVN